tara:strand:+ start:237 stop:1277 length:1041 start_codon:yes stop_codon:yes gene_type:complete
MHFISYIIPVRNENFHIESTIMSIINQRHEDMLFEIIVVDGMSIDGTRAKIEVLKKKFNEILMIDNPEKIVSSGFNRALTLSKGDFIVRVDGHAELSPDFLKNSLDQFNFTNADCVGGPIKHISNNIIGKSISVAQRSKFGSGGASFRGLIKSGKYVNTLAFGVYKRDVFKKIGGYDIELVKNQDDEFNFRMIQNKLKIWLHPSIKSYYYNRVSILGLIKQYFQYGFYKIRVFQKRGGFTSIRHLIPLLFFLTICFTVAIYFIYKTTFLFITLITIYLFFSIFFTIIETVFLKQNKKFLFLLPICFLSMHLSYGAGSLFGLIYFSCKWFDNRLLDTYFDREVFHCK